MRETFFLVDSTCAVMNRGPRLKGEAGSAGIEITRNAILASGGARPQNGAWSRSVVEGVCSRGASPFSHFHHNSREICIQLVCFLQVCHLKRIQDRGGGGGSKGRAISVLQNPLEPKLDWAGVKGQSTLESDPGRGAFYLWWSGGLRPWIHWGRVASVPRKKLHS